MEEYPMGYLFKTINDHLKANADADMKSQGLTFSQSRVLGFLAQAGGQATQKEIEVALEVSHPTVVGIVSRMEENGFLACHTDLKDRRNKIVVLTDKAKDLTANMASAMANHEERLLYSLDEHDRAELLRLLTIVKSNLE